MEERFSGRIAVDMDVCDVAGAKIGTVAGVHRRAGGGHEAGDEDGARPEDLLEVKTGFLGLGARLYIPLGEIREGTADCLFLGRRREEAHAAGWDRKPEALIALE